ncbi:hypothetical protein EQZ23_17960 [Sphingomonas sp. UV9]|uniref:hypothetical protein n=1 Tax=Sphingomonas sp. UV9 TaxID=1851410 RepID=UPI000FFBFA7A|nr:hypothetical protein [Sphingomonas sp. UV9]RXD02506.1 hypothetical protein EQZ23_17960 [Sphingomonas sp. UV9]
MQTFSDYAASKGYSTVRWEDIPSLSEPIYNFYFQFSHALSVGRRDGNPMILDVHVVDETGFGAFAGTYAEADAIVLYRDVPLLILKLARALISQGIILPDIRSDDVDLTPIIVPGSLNDFLGAVNVWDVPPLADSKREFLALKLAEYANLFIMAHEFAHIFNGHTSYVNRTMGISTIVELDSDITQTAGNYDRETLEWDADSFAQEHILKRAIESTDYLVDGRSALLIPETNQIGSLNDAIAIAFFSSAICSLFFSVNSYQSASDPTPKVHPHPAFRAAGAAAMIAQTLAFRTGGTEEQFQDILHSSIEQFLMTVKATFATPGEPKWAANVAQIGDPEVFGHALAQRTEIWSETWSRIHSELNEAKRGPMIPLATPARHPAFPDNDRLG